MNCFKNILWRREFNPVWSKLWVWSWKSLLL